MSNTTNHLELIIGSKLTIFFDDGSAISADAFRTNEAGVYVSVISDITGAVKEKISSDDLVFFPYAKISFMIYEVSDKTVVADEPSSANTPQG